MTDETDHLGRMVSTARQKTLWSQQFCALLSAPIRPFVIGAQCVDAELVVVVTSQNASVRLKSYRVQLLGLAAQLIQPAPQNLIVRIAKPITDPLVNPSPPNLRLPSKGALADLRAFAESLSESPLKNQMVRFFKAADNG